MKTRIPTGNVPKQLLFFLGQVVMTRGISDLIERGAIEHAQLRMLLNRHQCGDWGVLPPEDKTMNDISVCQQDRIISSYQIKDTRVWIITEADRSATTILLPSEY